MASESPQNLQLLQEKAVNVPPAGRREEEASATATEEPMYEPLP